jgi:hypothetical protein
MSVGRANAGARFSRRGSCSTTVRRSWTVPCGISPRQGARIYFADTAALPATFELEIPNKGLRVEGRVMWSRGANHGVMFRQKVKVWTEAPRAAVA